MRPSQPQLAVGGVSSRVVFVGVALVSLVVLFAPAGDVPSSPPGVDKLVHGAVFAALAGSGRWAGVRARALALPLVLYAAGSEVLQGLPALGRSASVADWVADVVGMCAGLAAWHWAARRPPT